VFIGPNHKGLHAIEAVVTDRRKVLSPAPQCPVDVIVGGPHSHKERVANLTDVPAQSKPAAESIRDAGTNLTAQIVAYFHDGQKAINEIIIVPLLISARIFRTYDAINMLLENGYVSEAAVLTLTQFELRLDLAYTAHDVTHATEWLGHERLDWSVAQKMDKKINSLFNDPDDRARLSDIFKYLSGIKHGNPAYSALGFPARQNGPGLEISTGEIADEFSGEFSRQIASYSTYQLAWSSQVLNVCTGQYAVVDDSLRQSVRNSYLALEPDEEAFRQYLTKLVAHSQGPFGLRRWKRKKNSNGDL
jgi:hypothetical protein